MRPINKIRTYIPVILLISLSIGTQAQNFEIYVSDAGNFNSPPWQILKFDKNGQNPTQFIGSNLNWPQDILFMEDSNTVLISNLGTGTITKHHAYSGNYIGNFAANISEPTRIKIGPDSLLYCLQWSGNGKVRRYKLNGDFVDHFTSVGVPQAIGMDWDNLGNLYVSSYSGDLVRKFGPTGADSGVFISTNLLGPTNIWFDSNGDLLVSDYNSTAIKRFDSKGVYINNFIQGLGNSEGVDFFPDGNILIGNGITSSVKMFDSNGIYIKDFISSGAGNLITPNAVRIREVAPISVMETIREEDNIMHPSIGLEFFIAPQSLNKLKSIEIYSLSGMLIVEIDLNSAYSWKANHHAEGVYFAVSKFLDGSISTQKIVVKR